jgi:hypothetical protein
MPSSWNWREDGDLDVRGVLRDAVCTQLDRRGYVSYKRQTEPSYAFAPSYLRTVPNGWNWLEHREHWVRICRFAQMR